MQTGWDVTADNPATDGAKAGTEKGNGFKMSVYIHDVA